MGFLRFCLYVILIIILLQAIILAWRLGYACWKYFGVQGKDLQRRYGKQSWAVITGASSGQGYEFAMQLADQGFNLYLVGSERTHKTKRDIHRRHPNTEIQLYICNLADVFRCPHIFIDIETETQDLDVSLLVNNVGHRTAWKPYHASPPEIIRDTIAVGTLVQSRLTHIFIPRFLTRFKEKKLKSGLIFVTAQCVTRQYMFGTAKDATFSVPYLSVYEAANAYGYFHANSLHHEYGTDVIDFLNITPGAVKTKNTPFLTQTWFAVEAETFVRHILKLLGNVQGATAAYWGHGFSELLVNLVPWIRKPILHQVGSDIAEAYMANYAHKQHSYKVDLNKQTDELSGAIRSSATRTK